MRLIIEANFGGIVESEIKEFFKKIGIKITTDLRYDNKHQPSIIITGISEQDYVNAPWVSDFNGILMSNGWDYNYPQNNHIYVFPKGKVR